jgi:hypothetical protein
MVDRDKKLVGIVAMADLARSRQDLDTKSGALEGVSESSSRGRS